MDTLKWSDTKRKPSVLYIAIEQKDVDKTKTKMSKPRKYFICADDLMDMRYYVRRYYAENEKIEKTLEDFVIMKVKLTKTTGVKFKEASNFNDAVADKPLRLNSEIEYELIDVFRTKGM